MAKPISSLSGLSKKITPKKEVINPIVPIKSKKEVDMESGKDLNEDFKDKDQEGISESDMDAEFKLETPTIMEADYRAIMSAFECMLAINDLTYFSSRGLKVCNKKYSKDSKDCVQFCQHFMYCKAKDNAKEAINKI